MSDADLAYAAAVAEIARVSSHRTESYFESSGEGLALNLSGQEFAGLNRLPPKISEFMNLTSIDLSHTQMGDAGIRTLAGFSGLRSIDLSYTRVRDIEPLSSLKRLQNLNLSGSRVIDLAALAHIKGLIYLSFNQTHVRDLSPLIRMTLLEKLYLSGSDVIDLKPLRDIKRLQVLDLSETQVGDLMPLSLMVALNYLDLSKTQVKDLTPLKKMPDLQVLNLHSTPIEDLAPIRAITSLESIELSGTQVRDLRPLSDLAQLGGVFASLGFAATPALELDKVLARIEKIKSYFERTKQTLAYLKSLPPWPEPLPWLDDGKGVNPVDEDEKTPTAPEQDAALPLIWGEKGFTFWAKSIGADAVAKAALEDLRDLLDDLRRKGNRHDDLYRLAGELQDRSRGEIAEIKMVKLHFSYQKLRRLYLSKDTRAEPFDDETVGVLGSVLEIVPGVTLADPLVRELIERQEADRLATPVPASVDAETAMLQAMLGEDAPFDDDVKDTVKSVLQPNQDDRLTATRGILSRNSLIALLRFFRHDAIGANITYGIGLSAATIAVSFIQNHGLELVALARTMGDDVFFWAQMKVSSFKAEYQLVIGATREVLGSSAVTLPKPKKKP